MKLKKLNLKIIVLSLTIGCTDKVKAQNWSLGGNLINGTEWFGATNTSTIPLQIRQNANQPINFHTNNSTTPRMTILGGGNVGIGLNNPTSLLHLSSTTSGNIFQTQGPWNLENRWQLLTASEERFKVYIYPNTNYVFLQASDTNGVFSFNTGGANTRMFMQGQHTNTSGTGNVAVGNNLNPFTFTPIDRMHLYQDAASRVAVRFSHSGTGATMIDGTYAGIADNGDFRCIV